MKKIGFMFIFLLVFLFFPFPKNLGPQDRPELKSITTSAETVIQQKENLLLSFLPAPPTWPKPLYLIWRVVHIDQAVREKANTGDWSEMNKLPPLLPQALVAIEDHRFYEHSGVDLDGILRALLANIQADEIVQGGSTITQQLVKNVVLSPTQTVERKVSELFLALLVESNYSKNDILEMYLNTTYYGAGAYGITQAAEIYFDKAPADLTLAECATLAGLPNAPSALNPYENLEACKERRNLVLNAMAKNGMITSDKAKEAAAEPILLRER